MEDVIRIRYREEGRNTPSAVLRQIFWDCREMVWDDTTPMEEAAGPFDESEIIIGLTMEEVVKFHEYYPEKEGVPVAIWRGGMYTTYYTLDQNGKVELMPL